MKSHWQQAVASSTTAGSHLEMIQNKLVLVIVAVVPMLIRDLSADMRGRRKNDYPDNTLWKKEFEDELTDAMLSSKKRDNVTRVAQSPPGGATDNEAVVEKLMDSLSASEKYLKKVESIDFRLNRLDIEVHEKTNNILKYLSEVMKSVRTQTDSEKMDTTIELLRKDVGQVKSMLEHCPPLNTDVEGRAYTADGSVDTRLSYIEGNVKSIMAGVDSIMSIISEVKNRQYSRTKSDPGSLTDTMTLLSEFRRSLYEQRTKKCDCRNGRVDRSERYPTDCHEIQMQGFNVSGIYKIKPDDMDAFYVLCDLTTAGGGWTVFQNRFDGSQDFYRGWSDYKHGFGNLAGEFWLGLEKLHYLTNQKLYELRVEMETQHGQEAYALYSVFTVGPELEGYRISTLGTFYGTAGDSLSYHAGQQFSTMDQDRDEWKDGSCALEHGGAWWYKECDKSNLNGKYATTADDHPGQNIYWVSFKSPNVPLTKVKMMIKPLPASKPSDFYKSAKLLGSSKMKGVRVPEKKLPIPATKESKAKGYELSPNHPYYEEAPQPANPFFSNYK